MSVQAPSLFRRIKEASRLLMDKLPPGQSARTARDLELERLIAERDLLSREHIRLQQAHEELTSETHQLRQHLDSVVQLINMYEAPGFKHAQQNARVAPLAIEPPDPPSDLSRSSVERVIDAYHHASGDVEVPDQSLWDHGNDTRGAFIDALQRRDIDTVQNMLSRMFLTDLCWGLARLSPTPDQHGYYTQIRCLDNLRNLAEAVGTARVISLEQNGPEAVRNALNVCPECLMSRIEARTGLDVSSPKAGAMYGCEINEKLVNADSLLHSYTVHRLRQLGASDSTPIVEIGGGFGCLAALAYRAGLTSFTIYDLPWVNALQGYFLIMVLPPGTVRLSGESEGTVRVEPFWRIHQLADRSADYVINCNSLPEIGAATARQYIDTIGRILRRNFLSLNQEARALSVTGHRQNWVGQLVEERAQLVLRSRSPYWMEQGYVEEVFHAPSTAE
jgi:hypothetical protein